MTFSKSFRKALDLTIIPDYHRNMSNNSNSAVPPVIYTRNEHGLLVGAGVPAYIFNEDGSVNWRKMINPKFLVPNKQKTKETDISKLEDGQLLILLGGIKELAHLRGFYEVSHNITSPSMDCVISVCHINFIPNYETEGRGITFSAVGDATAFNTNSFGKNFLGPIAENRAFVRCVRNFLKINIVGSDEISPSGETPPVQEPAETPAEDTPAEMLLAEMTRKGVTFQSLVNRLRTENFEGADSLTSVKDLSGFKILELLGRIKKIPAPAK